MWACAPHNGENKRDFAGVIDNAPENPRTQKSSALLEDPPHAFTPKRTSQKYCCPEHGKRGRYLSLRERNQAARSTFGEVEFFEPGMATTRRGGSATPPSGGTAAIAANMEGRRRPRCSR